MPASEPFGRIVVAFDGSKDSVKAVHLACSLASSFDSNLTVVHVYHSPVIAYGAGPGIPMPDYRDLEGAAEETGNKILACGVQLANDAGVKAKGELLQSSSVVETLVGFALNEKADLIVVGTRGMTGFKKLVLGSVSSGLVSHAPCPVLVAR